MVWLQICWLPVSPAVTRKRSATCLLRYGLNLIFVVPSIMLHSSEISPTRCNNYVFILRNGFTLHVSGDNLTHHQEYTMLYMATGKPEKTYNLSEPAFLWPYTYSIMYSWWWVRLSPETCRVKPLRRIKTQLLHLVGLISLLPEIRIIYWYSMSHIMLSWLAHR